ncbi:MAG: hypothetical protein AAF363_22015 [Bacteroidota bacterium]
MRHLFFICIFFFICEILFSQTKYEERETFKTEKELEWDRGRKKATETVYNYIYKKKPKNLLLGNKCLEDATKKMGFLYALANKGDGYNTETGRFFHNFGVKSKLFFTRGPLWKFKVKKERKRCRQLTGDFYG